MAYTLLRILMELEVEAIPLIKSKVDRDILIMIGAAQETGHLLSLKQLTLLGIGASATLRRRIEQLIKMGYLEKRTVENDGRVAQYAISKAVWKRMTHLESKLVDAAGKLEK
jgi:DNA-binding MarR family transcriptional regulator